MKKLFLLFILFYWTYSFGQKVEIAFRIPEKDLIPEGIAYNPESQSFFVSSIFKRKIVKIDAKKQVSDFISSGQDGIGEVLGLKVNNEKLWACSNFENKAMVHQYDIASGKLEQKWIFEFEEEKHLFNDLAVVNDEAFISDSDFGAIYHVSSQLTKPEVWVKDARLQDINGITLMKDRSVVVNASSGFFKLDLDKKEIISLPFQGYFPIGIDGLCFYKESLIGIQNVVFPVSINQYYLNGSLNQIEKARVLVANHPQFNIPTTSTIAGEWLYFIANSQLQNIEKGKIKDPSKLEEVLIMRVKLD